MVFKYVYAVLFIIIALVSSSHSQALDRTHIGWVNPLEYGATCTDDTLAATLLAVGTDEVTVFLPITDRDKVDCVWDVDTDITIPDNVDLFIPKGAMLEVAGPARVFVHGGFSCGFYQCISLINGGRVELPSSENSRLGTLGMVSPEWWGAKADGDADDSFALNAADDAFFRPDAVGTPQGYGHIYLRQHAVYRIAQTVTLERTSLVGHAHRGVIEFVAGNSLIIDNPDAIPGLGFESSIRGIEFRSEGDRDAGVPLLIIRNGPNMMELTGNRFGVHSGVGVQFDEGRNSRALNNAFFLGPNGVGIIADGGARLLVDHNEFRGAGVTGNVGVRINALAPQTHIGSTNIWDEIETVVDITDPDVEYTWERTAKRIDDKTWDPASIAAGGYAVQGFTVRAGQATFGSAIVVGTSPDLPDGFDVQARRDEANTNVIRVTIFNHTTGAVDLPSMDFYMTSLPPLFGFNP